MSRSYDFDAQRRKWVLSLVCNTGCLTHGTFEGMSREQVRTLAGLEGWEVPKRKKHSDRCPACVKAGRKVGS